MDINKDFRRKISKLFRQINGDVFLSLIGKKRNDIN